MMRLACSTQPAPWSRSQPSLKRAAAFSGARKAAISPAKVHPRPLPGRIRSIRHDATVTVEATGPGTATLVFTDPVQLGDFFAGVVESALRLSGVASPKVEVQPSATGDSLLASW